MSMRARVSTDSFLATASGALGPNSIRLPPRARRPWCAGTGSAIWAWTMWRRQCTDFSRRAPSGSTRLRRDGRDSGGVGPARPVRRHRGAAPPSGAPAAAHVAWHLHSSRDEERAFGVYADTLGWTAVERQDLGERGRHVTFAWEGSDRPVEHERHRTAAARAPAVAVLLRDDRSDAALARVRDLGGLTLPPPSRPTGTALRHATTRRARPSGCIRRRGRFSGALRYAQYVDHVPQIEPRAVPASEGASASCAGERAIVAWWRWRTDLDRPAVRAHERQSSQISRSTVTLLRGPGCDGAGTEHQVIEGGGAAVGPMRNVVGIAAARRAARETAACIARGERAADRRGNRPGPATDVQHRSVGTFPHHYDAGVARQAPRRFRGNADSPRRPAPAPPAQVS